MGMATALPLLFVARILAGITGGNISIPQAYIADVTAPEKRSRAMGMIGAAFGLGFTFGPLIGGIMSRISYSAPFYFAAAPGRRECRARLLDFARKPFAANIAPNRTKRRASPKFFAMDAARCLASSWRPIFF